MSRLEEIEKSAVHKTKLPMYPLHEEPIEYRTTINREDYNWLKNSAKRLEEMEESNIQMHKHQIELRKDSKEWSEIASRLHEENQRYKQALEEILEEAYEEAGVHPDTNMQLETFIVKKARQALKEESERLKQSRNDYRRKWRKVRRNQNE